MKHLTFDQRTRAKKITRNAAVILTAGLLYALLVRLTGWALPCPFWKLTGKVCAGCGVTRMCMALLRLDFAAAAGHNLLVLALLPFLAAYGIYRAVKYVLQGTTRFARWEGVVLCIAMALTLAFWVMRNMERFSFLLP